MHYVGLCCTDVQWGSLPLSLSFSPPPLLCVCLVPKEKSCAQMRTCMQHALERTKAHGTSALFNLTHTHTRSHTHSHRGREGGSSMLLVARSNQMPAEGRRTDTVWMCCIVSSFFKYPTMFVLPASGTQSRFTPQSVWWKLLQLRVLFLSLQKEVMFLSSVGLCVVRRIFWGESRQRRKKSALFCCRYWFFF